MIGGLSGGENPWTRSRSCFSPACLGCFGLGFALLLAIFIPELKCAREVAEMRACTRNMRHIGEALVLYAQDYDEHFPPAAAWAVGASRYLQPGDTSKQENFHCPANTRNAYGYALNAALAQCDTRQIANPSETVLLFESGSADRNAVGSSRDVVWGRHPTGASFCLADGHAKYVMGTPKHPNSHSETLLWSP
jgi:prepilin-type processing-associated H-X9-DG protein